MARDNPEKGTISVSQARDLVKKALGRTIYSDDEDVWIGDNIEQYRSGYLIPAMIVNKGESAPVHYMRIWVDSSTGEIGMTFDLTA